jgi:hypothetical protein
MHVRLPRVRPRRDAAQAGDASCVGSAYLGNKTPVPEMAGTSWLLSALASPCRDSAKNVSASEAVSHFGTGIGRRARKPRRRTLRGA